MSRLSHVDRRREILNAAVRISRRIGYQQISKNNVAKEVGCAPTLLFHYFSSLESLRREVMRQAVMAEDLAIIAQGLSYKNLIALNAPYNLRRQAAMSLLEN